MADRCLMITWGEVVRGREERALECFNDTLGYYGRCQQEGKIETFETVLCIPNGGRLDGYTRVEGSAKQMADLKEEREFQQLAAEATTIVENFAITDAYCNEGVAQQIGVFQEAIAKVPQMS
jgi:hypothetical protein